jgi:hypothetical protein
MIRWQIQGTDRVVSGEELPPWLQAGWLAPQAPVSADGGATWIPAAEAARRMAARGDDAVAMFVPMRTAPWAIVGQYVALFSLLFFGGPLAVGATAAAFDHGTKLVFKLGLLAVALVVGPLPPALAAWLARREIRRDPTLRGTGRMWFAVVCAVVMLLPLLVGLLVAPFR